MIKVRYIKSKENNYPELTDGKVYDAVNIIKNRIYLKGLKGYNLDSFMAI